MDYFINLTWQEGVKDIIDVAIVSYIIYNIIILVRKTRAVSLLKGIVLLLIVWGVSTLFNLYTLKWLLNQMFPLGVLTILIIFQPELRRVLEQLGRGGLFSKSRITESTQLSRMIDEIIRAVRIMSQKRVGALIVFERHTGLNEMIESGIKMESQISSELVMNIFTPNSPLHDGAVIIKNDQIMAAGCYLPLSENPFISKELGTRHRAAIGVSEVSDAISLIVSEETGQISLSINGLIVRDINEEALISKLHDELSEKNEHKTPLEKLKLLFQKQRGVDNG